MRPIMVNGLPSNSMFSLKDDIVSQAGYYSKTLAGRNGQADVALLGNDHVEMVPFDVNELSQTLVVLLNLPCVWGLLRCLSSGS